MDVDRTLLKLVSNLWFEWNDEAHLLFRKVSPYMWGLLRRNLYRFLKLQAENPTLYRSRIAELLTDPQFFQLYQKVENDFKNYMQPAETLVNRRYPELANRTIAYLSMEYGIDILPIYSGGLGILSGDHLRGASDIGLKMVGVGLLYLQGYYEQQVGSDGAMKVIYDTIIPTDKSVRDFLPLETVKDAQTHKDLIIEVPIDGRSVQARVWKVKIGKTDLLLLDSDFPSNPVHDRHITRRLYASQKQHEEERRRRLEQELMLGIGGVRALQGAGYDPAVYHLNEGHVAFAAIEVIRSLMQKESLSFEEARKRAAAQIGFTTHTPVPEGNERFDEKLIRSHLQAYLDSFLASEAREIIFNCARNQEDRFDMTKLALLLSGVFRNGVSQLHGEVCRRMWGFAWGMSDPSGKTVPIGSITNSVHVPYWQKPMLRRLIESTGELDPVNRIPDEKIWALHLEFKTKMIAKIRERLACQLLRERLDAHEIHERTKGLLDVDSFMIGFARRFADYKRTTFLLEDEGKLFQFLESSYKKYNQPVHLLFAGKPHPNNYPGYERIRHICEVANRLEARCRERSFRAQIVFIEGYDIDLARYLEAGVDLWLNNPIRPHEASGTSGMKAGMNGVLNVSIPDGWVPEGIVHGKNGWLFGKGEMDTTGEDREELFKLLEETVLPLYFERKGSAFSSRWLAMMKASIQTITAQFNTERMLTEYVEKMYLPAVKSHI